MGATTLIPKEPKKRLLAGVAALDAGAMHLHGVEGIWFCVWICLAGWAAG